MYDNIQEAVQKLQSTVVAYDGQPFVVSECVTAIGGVGLRGYVPGTPKDTGTKTYPITDPGFCFHNLGGRLGYANVETNDRRGSVWVRRVPVRKAQATQGLSSFNTKITRLQAPKTSGVSSLELQFQTFKGLPGFRDMFGGKYPTLRDAGQVLYQNRDVYSQAFARHLAIRRTELGIFLLLYKDQEIGYSEDLVSFRVPKQFRYLDELLIEDNNLTIR